MRDGRAEFEDVARLVLSLLLLHSVPLSPAQRFAVVGASARSAPVNLPGARVSSRRDRRAESRALRLDHPADARPAREAPPRAPEPQVAGRAGLGGDRRRRRRRRGARGRGRARRAESRRDPRARAGALPRHVPPASSGPRAPSSAGSTTTTGGTIRAISRRCVRPSRPRAAGASSSAAAGSSTRQTAPREVFAHDATCESLRVNNTILTSSIAYPRAAHAELGPLDPGSAATATGTSCSGCAMPATGRRRFPGSPSATRSAPRACPGHTTPRGAGASSSGSGASTGSRSSSRTTSESITCSPRWRCPTDGTRSTAHSSATFRLESFPAAIAFVSRVAELAEAENHHPEIAISYRDVTLRWRTHSADAITDRDRELASASAALA